MTSKAGFTLLETMVVIAITGLTISLIYTVGMRGVFNGFRLGNRALTTADMEIAKAGYRDVLQSIVIPPVGVDASTRRSRARRRSLPAASWPCATPRARSPGPTRASA